jgi:hypothetical protein
LTEEGTLADQVVRPPVAILEHRGVELESGAARTSIPHLDGSNAHSKAVTERSYVVRWEVRATAADAAVRITAAAAKAGVARTEWVVLNGN